MAKDRGHYSSQYDVIYDSPEYEALSLEAAAVWNALRHWPFPGTYALGLVQVFREPLAYRAKVPMDRLQPALRELEEGNWIVTEGRWIWLRNFLKFDPHYLPENPNHVKGVLNTLAGLPSIDLIDRFTDYYRAQRNDRGTPFLPPEAPYKSKSRKAKVIPNQNDFDSQSKPVRLPITEAGDSNPVAVAGTGAITETNERTEAAPPAPVVTTPPTALTVVVDPPWNRELAEMWIAIFGGGAPVHVFRAVKPGVKSYGWERVKPVLRWYLEQTPLIYVNVPKVLSGLPSMEAQMRNGENTQGAARASPGKKSIGATAMDNARQAIEANLARRGK